MKKFKKFLAATGLFGFIQSAQAFYQWIIISLLVIVVGGIVVVKLDRLTKKVWAQENPPPNVDNTVIQVYEDNELLQRVAFLSLSIGLQTGVGHDEAQNSPADQQPYSMSLQYCYDTNTWLRMGTNLNNAVLMDYFGDTNSYAYTITIAGFTTRHYYFFGFETNVFLAYDTNLYIMVIERSTSLSNWQPIHTNNYYKRFDVTTFTDTNAPSQQAFYRIRQEFY